MDATEKDKRKLRTLILAAGKGTRMKSDLAKVLHTLCGRPLLAYSIAVAKALNSEEIIVVIGHQADLIRRDFSDQGLIFVEQRQQLGTGHAVLQARDLFRHYRGDVLILCGDVPLLKPATAEALIAGHRKEAAAVTVLTTILDNPTGYGRMVKGQGNRVLRIVEERDATEAEKKIREINTGIYCARADFLFDAVGRINNENAQKEYYLTDIVEIAKTDGLSVDACLARDPTEVLGINTVDELFRAAGVLENRERTAGLGAS
ncbi:MAG: NTP transferase domain-containing protein [Deltaproteobacteria bacterium]|nr:NTP transferase domain-containing protein [Deltaproteobacteria bacterium]